MSLLDSEHFCMAPWISVQVRPNGDMHPCCIHEYTNPFGNVRTDTIESVWNNNEYKQLRVDMLNNKQNDNCKRCFWTEENGCVSQRNKFNNRFARHISDTELTHQDGTHPEMKLRYFDVRFSNICNMKCRSCGAHNSTSWQQEYKRMHKGRDIIFDMDERKPYTLEQTSQIVDNALPYIEEIYFAGGEPLMMPEHLMILQKLIAAGRTDVKLLYNTNFSKTKYSGVDIFELWSQFDYVYIGASLDASGARAEYMRKGTNWSTIIRNRHLLADKCPNARFAIAATVSVFNVHHVIDFYAAWVELGLVESGNFNVCILSEPNEQSITVLPQKYKDMISEKYKSIVPNLNADQKQKDIFANIVTHMNSANNTHLLNDLLTRTISLDKYRSESFASTFPEFAGLLQYHNGII